MTAYSWHAYAGDILDAEGARSDHRDSPDALACEVGAELRAAGVPVTSVAVRAIRAARTSGCPGPGGAETL